MSFTLNRFTPMLTRRQRFCLMNEWPQKLFFPATIWQVRPDPLGGGLAVEVRDGPEKRATFFWLDLSDVSLRPLSLSLPDPWWVTLYACWQGHLILQGYQEPGLPLPQGIYVYDLADGRLRWSDPQRRCAGLTPDALLTRHAWLPQRHEQLALQDGRATAMDQPDWQAACRQGEDLLFGPMALPNATAQPQPPLTRWMDLLPPPQQPGPHPIHWLALPERQLGCAAWYVPHVQSPTHLTQYLGLWRRDQLAGTFVLQPDTQQLAPDPFMVWRQYLIWQAAGHHLLVGDLDALPG